MALTREKLPNMIEKFPETAFACYDLGSLGKFLKIILFCHDKNLLHQRKKGKNCTYSTPAGFLTEIMFKVIFEIHERARRYSEIFVKQKS